MIADALSRTYKESPSPSSEQSLLYTDYSYSTPVLPTIATQHLTVNLPTSTTLPFTTSMPSQPTPRSRMSNMTSRYENIDEYDPEDWKLKVNTESDESRRVCEPSQQLRTEAAAARRTPNTITTEQVNQILSGERDRRWTEFYNRMLRREQQAAANTLRGEAADALIALSQAASTTATTTRAQARAETTPQLVIPKPQRLDSIVIENNKLQNRPPTPIPPLEEIEEEREDEEELEEWEVTGRRSMSVEDMARDIGATLAHKRTEVPTKTELAK